MDAEEKKHMALSAHMEGREAIVRSIGKRIKLSEMEVICLVNFAEVGLMSLFAQLDGGPGEHAEAHLENHLNAIRREFASEGATSDGLAQLQTTTAALLRGRLQKYMVDPTR